MSISIHVINHLIHMLQTCHVRVTFGGVSARVFNAAENFDGVICTVPY